LTIEINGVYFSGVGDVFKIALWSGKGVSPKEIQQPSFQEE